MAKGAKGVSNNVSSRGPYIHGIFKQSVLDYIITSGFLPFASRFPDLFFLIPPLQTPIKLGHISPPAACLPEIEILHL